MAQTSVLPQPTRVERQEFGNLTPNMTHVIDPLDNSNLMTGVPVSAATGPLIYSDDELAVLAKSFFHQSNDLDGNANWWNSMNMDAT